MTAPDPENPKKASAKSGDLEARVRHAASLKFLSNCTDAQLAEDFGVSVHTISNWKRRPEWKTQVKVIADRQIADTCNEFLAMAPYARSVIQDILRDGPPALRLKAAQAICELPLRTVAGYK